MRRALAGPGKDPLASRSAGPPPSRARAAPAERAEAAEPRHGRAAPPRGLPGRAGPLRVAKRPSLERFERFKFPGDSEWGSMRGAFRDGGK